MEKMGAKRNMVRSICNGIQARFRYNNAIDSAVPGVSRPRHGDN